MELGVWSLGRLPCHQVLLFNGFWINYVLLKVDDVTNFGRHADFTVVQASAMNIPYRQGKGIQMIDTCQDDSNFFLYPRCGLFRFVSLFPYRLYLAFVATDVTLHGVCAVADAGLNVRLMFEGAFAGLIFVVFWVRGSVYRDGEITKRGDVTLAVIGVGDNLHIATMSNGEVIRHLYLVYEAVEVAIVRFCVIVVGCGFIYNVQGAVLQRFNRGVPVDRVADSGLKVRKGSISVRGTIYVCFCY